MYGDLVDYDWDRLWDIFFNQDPNDLQQFMEKYTNKYGMNDAIWSIFYNQRAWWDVYGEDI